MGGGNILLSQIEVSHTKKLLLLLSATGVQPIRTKKEKEKRESNEGDLWEFFSAALADWMTA